LELKIFYPGVSSDRNIGPEKGLVLKIDLPAEIAIFMIGTLEDGETWPRAFSYQVTSWLRIRLYGPKP
jgi:hypothetical protein